MTPPHPVILTRPAGRNHALAAHLHAHGVATLELPALAITPIACDARALPRPADYELVVFVSSAAARAYAEQLQCFAHLKHWPAHIPVACVGPATARSLCGPFWPQSLTVHHPEPDAPHHDSEALWQVLQPVLLHIQRVLIVRGAVGREWLAEQLIQRGIHIPRHAVYQRHPADWPDAARATLARWRDEHQTPVWLITSTASLTAIATQLAHANWLDWSRTHHYVLTHPRFAPHLSTVLGDVPDARIQLCTPDTTDMVRALLAGSTGEST